LSSQLAHETCPECNGDGVVEKGTDEVREKSAQAMLAGDPTVALYVAAVLARRLDVGNRSIIEVKHQIQSGEPLSAIGKAVEKVETQLNHSVRDPTGW
jgi:hypothetical protein